MPGYSPLPRIELDPRTEAELVKAASRRVYEASNSTINDFSAGSPIMALLEGQAFSQAEFLQFANQFPEAVLVEWIGPFLGAQRRTGAGAIVDIEFIIVPRDQQFEVFEGYQLATNSNLTGGESFKFVTTERLSIPPGESRGVCRAVSIERGVQNNVPSNTIVRSLTSLSGVISITNPQPAVGGQNAESLSEVKERFFSLIRRRNPTSAEDWLDFFTDALGPGTSCIVKPRQSERDFYRYETDYVSSNPAVSFFLLNPDGTGLTQPQIDALSTLSKWSLPTEYLGYIYSMEVDEVDFFLEIEYNPNRPYAQNLLTTSQQIRNSMFQIMTPNAVFPVGYDIKVSDVESALTASFPLTLGTEERFVDPSVTDIKAYFTPQGASEEAFMGTKLSPFVTGERLKEDDLVVDFGSSISEFYRVVSDFDPSVNDKMFNVNLGNLEIKIIKQFVPGPYVSSEVLVTDVGDLYVALVDFDYSGKATIGQLIENNFIAEANVKSFDGLLSPTDDNGNYSPDVVVFDQKDTDQVIAFPSSPVELVAAYRPGSPIYVVAKPFVVTEEVTSLGSAQSSGLVEKEATEVKILTEGEFYSEGTYVKTPSPAEMYSGSIDTETCYLTTSDGALEVFAKVEKSFTFETNSGSYSDAVQVLFDTGLILQVATVPFIDCRGVSTFASRPFRYHSRFLAGEYLRYRSVVSDPNPRYFIALKDFTPETQDVNEMITRKLIVEVSEDLFTTNYRVIIPKTKETYSDNITQALFDQGFISEVIDLEPSFTVEVVSEQGLARGVYVWDGGEWGLLSNALPKHREMFRFAPGDVVSFRNTSSIRNYVANEHVTPIMELEPYVTANVFQETVQTATVKWVDPLYRMEDVIVHTVNGAKSFYRVSRSFTPSDTKDSLNGTILTNSPRLEELDRNLLKIVDLANCLSQIRARLPNNVSASKLGRCNLKLKSKSTGSETSKYVWENTEYASVTSALSYYSEAKMKKTPVEYGDGTLAL